jgi:hypothetical protein
MLVQQPWLAGVIGCLFVGAGLTGSTMRPEDKQIHRTLLFPAPFWWAYAVWEYAVQRGRAGLRLDLFIIYPFLAGLTLLAVGVWCANFFHALTPAADQPNVNANASTPASRNSISNWRSAIGSC